MHNEMESLYDIRFAFRYDNPFPNDNMKESLKELRKHLSEHSREFIEYDADKESRYLTICPNTRKLFGKRLDKDNNISDNPIQNYIKKFIQSVNGISDNLKSWSSLSVVDEVPDCEVPEDEVPDCEEPECDVPDCEDDTLPSYEEFAPLISNNSTLSNMPNATNYDISTERTLSFESVRKLTINIARNKLVPDTIKDETVTKLEEEKKKVLIQQITRYRNVKVIAMMDDSDLSSMSLSQLETCLEQCIKYHENFKTVELFKRGFGLGGSIYDAVFPEGIPLTDTKRLKFDGVGKEMLSTLFDPHTPVGLAFANILEKHNVHVSDELLTLVAFASICVSKVRVEDISKNNNEVISTPEIKLDSESLSSDDSLLIEVSDEED